MKRKEADRKPAGGNMGRPENRIRKSRGTEGMERKKVGIVGGGAAGMMAAITAARAGAKVTILESGERIGKKILSTGNGKCNLGNLEMNRQQYYGGCGDRMALFLERFGTEDTLRFFGGLGLMTKERNGYLYPLCEQASAVLDVLRFEINALGIRVLTQFPVKEIRRQKKGGFLIVSDQKKEEFDSVILSCGGKAAPKTGSDGSGYQLAKQMGHHIIPVVPALTALKCKETFFKAIAGVRAEAEIVLYGKAQIADTARRKKGSTLSEICRERGELMITDYGISGIPIFQLSRNAAYLLKNEPELTVKIDFLPDYPESELNSLFEKRWKALKKRTAEEFFTGVLNKKLMALFMKQEGIRAQEPASDALKENIRRVFLLCKQFTVTVTGTGDFQNAQVCAGGVDLREVTDRMESAVCPGLYFAGEILDVDGRCGGYNLQWAWTSGYLAGSAAAEGKGMIR